ENVASLAGYPSDQFLRQKDLWVRLIHPDDLSHVMADTAQLSARPATLLYRIRNRDGQYRWVQNAMRLVRNADGQPLHITGVITDVTGRRNAEDAIRNIDTGVSAYTGEQFFQSLVRHLAQALDAEFAQVAALLPGRARMRSIAAYFRGQILTNVEYDLPGTPSENVIEKGLSIFPAGLCQAFPRVEILKTWGMESYVGMPLVNRQGDAVGLISIMSAKPLERADLTGSILRIFAVRAAAELERRTVEERLSYNAFHDSLTGLPNRALFLDRLEQALKRLRRRRESFVAVLFLDLDRFKVVNDALGHMAGDHLLVQVAQRLQACVREADTVARLGGDEFALLLDPLTHSGEAVEVAERIQSAIQPPCQIDGQEIAPSASIGIALSSAEATDPSELLRNADIAMYRAKSRGRSCYQIFDAEMHAQALGQLQLEAGLRHAVERGELEVHVQPIVCLATGAHYGVETLLRWRHPQRGLMPAGAFVRLAEESGLIVPIGWWAIGQACHLARQWQILSPDPPRVIGVNLSRRQFSQADLAPRLCALLEETGVEPRNIVLEVTESVLMSNPAEIRPRLTRLKSIGFGLAMDDFGTGYSSLELLNELPIDTMKVDRSFVDGLGRREGAREIVRAMISVAASLGMRVIGEGVESDEQAGILRELGCEYGQGLLFGAPAPFMQVAAGVGGV
ncbi:MAG: putative bifunctional diguanylate cyclase/phosphodiesterase, partial [Bryobacteraceae bacterium]